MAITPLPTPPSRQRPTEFSNEADAFLGALPTFGSQANQLAVEVNTKTLAAGDSAILASQWATKTDGTVEVSEYSAKEYASGTTVESAKRHASGTTTTGSAKDWATKTDSEVVAGQGFGAKKYASDAASSASAAASSAVTATTKAGEASASALAASGSASAAENSAIEASKLNLGAKATAPTVDNQGDTLRVGATYFDTSLDLWKVWTGSAWGVGLSVDAGVASIGGKQGVLTLADTSFTTATVAEMQAGTEAEPRSMSPALVSSAISSLARSKIIRSARTSNVQLTKADSGNLIDITSGTFTQTFAAASELGDGWFCYLKNSGAGDITLVPEASELIDGLTSYIMYPGEVRLVQCDGVELRTVVLNAFYKVFTASGNFIKPPGYVAFSGLLCGAGGSGGSGTDTQIFGSGGAGGARSPFQLLSSQVAASVLVVIGAGGSAVTGSIGNSGGQTSFGAIALNGGAGGNISNSAVAGGATSFDATLTSLPRFNGGAGGQGSSVAIALNGGANGIYGAGGGGGANNGSSTSPGGTSAFAGAGGLGGGTTPGSATSGSAPGGGGGGARYSAPPYPSGAGGRGELSIWGII